jgi:hypothetical protein
MNSKERQTNFERTLFEQTTFPESKEIQMELTKKKNI